MATDCFVNQILKWKIPADTSFRERGKEVVSRCMHTTICWKNSQDHHGVLRPVSTQYCTPQFARLVGCIRLHWHRRGSCHRRQTPSNTSDSIYIACKDKSCDYSVYTNLKNVICFLYKMIFSKRRTGRLRDCGYLPQWSLLSVPAGDGFAAYDETLLKPSTTVNIRNGCMAMFNYLPDDKKTPNHTE